MTTRRDFLRQTALLGAGLTISPFFIKAGSAGVGANDKIGVGLIGCNGMGFEDLKAFLAVNPDGTVSLQVLESSQIDMSDPAKKAMFEKGTHFNPVDLVCAVKNHKGEKYNLPDYVDKNTGFISYKSKDGRELKALELPGLWNGAMSDWNTVFVEVPIETFNPVKTVNDLLRPEHQ